MSNEPDQYAQPDRTSKPEDEDEEYEPIAGVVARVLSNRRLVLNRGSEHGVQINDIFAIYRPDPEKIVDPETGDEIGSVFLEKLRVKVVEVEPRMSIASTYRKFKTGGLPKGSLFGADLFGPEREVTETINAPREDMPSVDQNVAIGDPVKELLD